MQGLPRAAARTAAAAAVVALPLAAVSAPAVAQETRNTLAFEVTTTGDCSGTEFVGASGVPGSEFVFVDLTDDDGDGVHTGEQSLDPEDTQQVVQIRADDEVIHDAGTITVEGDVTVEATYDCGTGAGMPDTGADAGTGWVTVAGGVTAGALATVGILLLRRRDEPTS